MYGEGNSAKLLGDIINGTTQVTEGLSSGMGLDIKSLIAGAIGGKLTHFCDAFAYIRRFVKSFANR